MSSARAALPYVSALLASVLIGALIRWQLLQHLLHREIAYSSWLVTCIYGLMLAYALSLVLYLALLLWAYLPRLRRNAACSRRLLALLGALGSAEVIANLASLNLGIVRLGIASYALLLDGLLLYVSVNLSFFSGTGISITPCALSALMLTCRAAQATAGNSVSGRGDRGCALQFDRLDPRANRLSLLHNIIQ